MLPKTANAVVIGGGVMGVSSAYHLAKRGLKNIVLLERDAFFGTRSTGRCAGGIRHQFSTRVNIELSIHSIQMLENFEEEMSQPIDFKQTGYLILLSTEEEKQSFTKSIALQNKCGVASRLLSIDEIAERVPMLNLDGIIAATFYERDGTADPSGVVQGYVNGARRNGVTLLNDIEVTNIQTTDSTVTAVETNVGRVETPLVINAAGAWAGKIGAMAGAVIPIVPERQQSVVTNPLPEVPDDFPFVIDFHQRLYFHQEGEGLLTGQSIVGKPATFDETVDKDWIVYHLGNAIERLPLLEKASLMTEWAGLYENTPDAHPIIGQAGLEGFYVVAGFSGHGFMHGPIAGKLIAEQILDGKATTVDIYDLRYDRFQGDVRREFNVI